MEKREFKFLSKDGKTQIHAIEWVPDDEVKAVLQICHGMVEYIDRYDEFACFLAERGIYITGHDHLGHGNSVSSKEEHGYFPEKNGNQCVIGDIHTLRNLTKKKYPDVPYFMLGHSMGSFLLRQYLTMQGKGLSGAIIMGTGLQPMAILKAGQAVCKTIAKVKGWKHRSKLVDNMAFGSYNKKFEPAKTGKDWITSDEEHLMKYVSDPFCSYVFTVAGYYQMFEGMKSIATPAAAGLVPKNLPVFFVAGAQDPVGEFGKGVEKVFEQFKDAGILDVQMKLYENDRHEILNEKDRGLVYEDLYAWIEKRK